MKNIHILPTDKPSKLVYNSTTKKLDLYSGNVHSSQCKNIYITSDEIVTEYSTDLYFIDVYTNTRHIFSPIYINKDTIAAGKFHTYMNDGDMCKKIILTTDQDLIKDGVQAIDDEFLEWFCKNPSCKVVETFIFGFDDSIISHSKKYEIIIPKEETKQRLEKYSERFDNKDNEIVKGIFNPETWGKRMVNDEPKQETLEEAAERIYTTELVMDVDISEDLQSAFINGAKWQQERSYGEEDFKEILTKLSLVNPAHLTMVSDGCGEFPDSYKLTEKGVNHIIEQFKKK